MLADSKQIFKKGMVALHKNVVFTVALCAAIITSFFHKPNIGNINFKVLFTLFSLMMTVKALDKLGFLAAISSKLLKYSKTQRSFFIIICFLSFVFSMFLTNDVTILTLLPIVFAVSAESGMEHKKTSIFVGIFAVLGSVVTPFGNTQNLTLYSHFKMDFTTFFPIHGHFLWLALHLFFFVLCLFLKEHLML